MQGKPVVTNIAYAAGHYSRENPACLLCSSSGGNSALYLKTNTNTVTLTFDLLTLK